MSTIESAAYARMLIRAEGRFEDDPQILAIYRYWNPQAGAGGKTLYMVAWVPSDIASMYRSPLVVDPVLLWDRQRGITPEGAVEIRS